MLAPNINHSNISNSHSCPRERERTTNELNAQSSRNWIQIRKSLTIIECACDRETLTLRVLRGNFNSVSGREESLTLHLESCCRFSLAIYHRREMQFSIRRQNEKCFLCAWIIERELKMIKAEASIDRSLTFLSRNFDCYSGKSMSKVHRVINHRAIVNNGINYRGMFWSDTLLNRRGNYEVVTFNDN